MAIPTISTSAHAVGAGWGYYGQAGNFWGEKSVQGGKVMACGATSAALIASINNTEVIHEHLALSPMHDKNNAAWKGHI